MSLLPGPSHAHGQTPAEPDPGGGPVFILTGSRSGSTLLRFILDSHPELACPPETGFSSACTQLARAWDVLDNGDSETEEAAGSSPEALAALRDSMDRAYGTYLRRRGKGRWCDKSLDNHLNADLLAELYPEARFICLYRHCMDMVASAVETCPWGLHRYGLDPYVAMHPGNSVAAVGSYWQATASSILKFEENHPESCLRVRYEELVTAPEESAAAIFAFLGVRQVPGITRECFSAPHESNGPGDDKVWFTDSVSTDSVGRGVVVPAAALHGPLRDSINDILGQLGYRTVGDDWNTATGHVDPRADATMLRTPDQARAEIDAVVADIAGRAGQRSPSELREITARWPVLAGQALAIVVQDAGGARAEFQWRFDPEGTGAPAAGEPAALVIASPATWRALLGGKTNVIAAMTAGQLRCVHKRDTHRLRTQEVQAAMALLGVTRVPPAGSLAEMAAAV
ncbi:MAG: sulfotransferase family protein [Trebonia sp.]